MAVRGQFEAQLVPITQLGWASHVTSPDERTVSMSSVVDFCKPFVSELCVVLFGTAVVWAVCFMRRTLTERWSYTSHVFPFAPNVLLRYLCSWNVSRDTKWSHLVVNSCAWKWCIFCILQCNFIAVIVSVDSVRSWPFVALSDAVALVLTNWWAAFVFLLRNGS